MLAQEFDNQDPVVREEICDVMRGIEDPQADAVLTKAMRDPDRFVRKAALSAIKRWDRKPGVGLLPDLVSALQDEDEDVAHEAFFAILFMDRANIETGSELVRSENPRLRHQGIELLGMAENVNAVPLLIELLNNDDTAVRIDVIKELGFTGDPRAVPALIPFLKDQPGEIQKQVQFALRRITAQPADRSPEEWEKWWAEAKWVSPIVTADRSGNQHLRH